MSFKNHFALLAAALVSMPAATQDPTPHGHAPRCSDVEMPDGDPARVTFTLRWPNAFHNERNHDGAWIVLRGPDPRRGPLRLSAAGHEAAGAIPAEITRSTDALGVFVAPATAHRGDVEWRATLALDEPAPANATPWAVGMVHVPAGPFELGDDDPLLLRFGAFHRVGASDGTAGVFPVADKSALRVADEPGALWYRRDRNGYHGDQGGPLPMAWPKGTHAFWIMKHELTQGEYAAFLNTLPAGWRAARAPFDREGKEAATCTIAADGERVAAGAPDRPCNFVSWDDTCAWADWMALRPMTECEFEKAARGPRRPVAADYPWGTTSLERMQRRVQRTRDLTLASPADEAALDDAARERLGASYFWVMDLSGSVWERVVSAGHPAGRSFVGSNGDGVLTEDGRADNADWPTTTADGELAPGVGFRGGAEYFAPARPDDPTNPCSRPAARTFGGWGGANRYVTYSARAVRMADGP